jgi:hypothetical protein
VPTDAGTLGSGPPSGSPVQPSEIVQRKSFLPIALPLAFLAGLICLLSPLLGWLGLVGTVVWGVFRYQRKSGAISAGTGARLGALMGLFTFVFVLLLGTLNFGLSLLAGHHSDEFRANMVKQIQQAAASSPDPRAKEMMLWFTTGEGLVVLVAFGLFVFFIIILVSATATGAVTGAVANKKPQQ